MRINKMIFYSLIFMCIACSHKFHYATKTKIDSFGSNPLVFDIDSSFSLYVRTVIKEKDQKTGIARPVNGIINSNSELIEEEYLFISKAKRQLLIVNNIANRSTVFYRKPEKVSGITDVAQDINVNIWYFAQYRFGTFLSEGKYRFIPAHISSKFWQEWEVQDNADTIHIDGISLVNNYGESKSIVSEAFSIPVFFVRVNNFKLAFKDMVNGDTTVQPGSGFQYPESKVYMYKAKKGWNTVYKFSSPVVKHFNYIYFNPQRIYSLPQ